MVLQVQNSFLTEVLFVFSVICCVTEIGDSNTVVQSSVPMWDSLTNYQFVLVSWPSVCFVCSPPFVNTTLHR